MMDIQRYLLIAAIAVLSFMLLTEWTQFRAERREAPATSQQRDARPDSAGTPAAEKERAENDLPSQETLGSVPEAEHEEKASAGAEVVTVKTDVLNMRIDLRGGDVVYAALPKHYAAIDKPEQPFVLLEQDRRLYVAQSGLVGKNGTDTAESRPRFTAARDAYTLGDADTLDVDLHYQYSENIDIIKRYRFSRGDYNVKVQYLIDNKSDQPWQGIMFAQLKRDSSPDPSADSNGGFGLQPFLGVAYRLPDDPFEKLDFDDIRKKPLKVDMAGGWIAMIQHYFVAAWVPDSKSHNIFSTVVTRSGNNIARVTMEPTVVAPGESGVIEAQLYAGPKDQYALEKISPGLELSVDYGWLWWIAQPLFWLLTQIHNLVGNWGWSIVLLTVLIKAAFFQLNAKAFKSMANMRRVQPKLLELRERYSDDRQKQSQAMMELYKKEKINPMGGCLPILVQMPVFIALYWVLMESVELRHAPWILWINDLASMDPYFILPLIMGASMWIQQKLNPPPPDPMQAKIMQWLPIIFTFFFLFFPAGLVLYWVVNNTLSIVQQYIITRRLEGSPKKA